VGLVRESQPAGSDASETFLPDLLPRRVAPAQATKAHGLVDIPGFVETTTITRGGADIWLGASSAEHKLATVDEVGIREAKTRSYCLFLASNYDGMHTSAM
jgi:hypothetical protein